MVGRCSSFHQPEAILTLSLWRVCHPAGMARFPAAGPPPRLAADHALFLDVDGTLAPFAATPEAVTIPPTVVADLARLQDRLDGALALLSGRPLDQLDRLFFPLHLSAGALHGHHWRHAGQHGGGPPPPAPALASLRLHADRLARTLPGILVETKPDGLALHWRQAPQHGAAVMAAARQWLVARDEYGQWFQLQPGNQVVEFLPRGSDKGQALEQLMRLPPFHGRRPLHIGDDLTDEHAFRAAHALGGTSVLVGGRTPSCARHHLPSPSHLHAWLHEAASAPTDGVAHVPRLA